MTDFKEYLNEKRLNGVKENSLDTIQWVLESMDKVKPLDTCTEADLKKRAE